MIVIYNDFVFVKDEGFLALAYRPEGEEPQILARVHLGDTLGSLVGKTWTHQQAPADVVSQVAPTRDVT